MTKPLLPFAIFLSIAVICWWALLKARKTGEIYYRGDTWQRKKNPVLFWMIVFLCLLFGVAAPILFIAREGPDIGRSLLGLFE
jgi:hypothetical protein